MRKPEYLNAVIGDNNASKSNAETFQDYTKDETFGESANDTTASYFDDTLNPGRVKKMIQYASRNVLG